MRLTRLRLFSWLVPTGLAASSLAAACGGEPEPIALETSVELLDAFAYDTGELPGSGPVQVSLKVSGSATAKVRLPAIASEASGDAALHPAGPGMVEVSGGFFLDGTLKVDQAGLPSYDGDLPGLADVSLPILGSAPVTGFAIGQPVTVSAVIAPGELPAIPLPGGLPGKLKLSVGEGSTIDVVLEGYCASVDGTAGEYQGGAYRSGTVNLDIAVELDTGIAGSKSFDIGTVAIPLPEDGYDIAASAEGFALEEAPEGSTAAPACESSDGGEGGGSGEGGAGVTPSTSKGSTSATGATSGSTSNTSSTSSGNPPECTSDDDCGGGRVCRYGTCKDVLELCINQTLHVGDLSLAEGDAEFGGHGPDVEIGINPIATGSGLDLEVHVKMRETQSDWTTGERTQTFSFAGQVGSTVSPGLGWSYTDDDTSDDPLGGYEGFVLSGKCSADTFGNDVCDGSNCSWCELEIGCVKVTAP